MKASGEDGGEGVRVGGPGRASQSIPPWATRRRSVASLVVGPGSRSTWRLGSRAAAKGGGRWGGRRRTLRGARRGRGRWRPDSRRRTFRGKEATRRHSTLHRRFVATVGSTDDGAPRRGHRGAPSLLQHHVSPTRCGRPPSPSFSRRRWSTRRARTRHPPIQPPPSVALARFRPALADQPSVALLVDRFVDGRLLGHCGVEGALPVGTSRSVLLSSRLGRIGAARAAGRHFSSALPRSAFRLPRLSAVGPNCAPHLSRRGREAKLVGRRGRRWHRWGV